MAYVPTWSRQSVFSWNSSSHTAVGANLDAAPEDVLEPMRRLEAALRKTLAED